MSRRNLSPFIIALLLLAGLLAAMLCVKSDVAWHALRNYALIAGRYSVPYGLFFLAIASLSVIICLAFAHPASKSGRVWKLVSVYFGIALYCLFATLAAFEFILQRNPMWVVTPQTSMDPMQIVLFSLDQWRADDEAGVLGRPGVSAKLQGPFALYSLYDPSAWKDEARPQIVFKTDAQGFRNDGEIESPDMVVIGDSFTHGAFVDRDEIWSSQLAERLNKTEQNFGLSAFSPQQSNNILQRFGLPQSPKIVVYQLFFGNDFDDAAQFHRWKQSGKAYLPFLREQLGEMPQLAMTWQWFRDRFLHQEKQTQSGWRPIECRVGSNTYAMGFGPPGGVLYQEKEQILAYPGFAMTIETIEAMARECRDAGAHFLVCAVPAKASVYMDCIVDRENQERFLRQQGLSNQIAFEDARSLIDNLPALFEEEMKQRGIDFVDLTLPLRGDAVEKSALLYYPFDTHWNPGGHAAAAQILTEEIRQLGWINQDSNRD
ncbi:MAG: SGNH/GDSL hydrolase family protein [Candidatus Hinthialibacter antarcticus]|nr:SGNH/GDSL hydrolase family protein [Candidatus Hinthialibacter antarcticus]